MPDFFKSMKQLTKGRCLRAIIISVAGLNCFGLAGNAVADVNHVEVKRFGELGEYAGRNYLWVKADMHGTVSRKDGSTGIYRVPVTMVYPDKDPSGFGFVDVVNTAAFALYTEANAPEGKRIVYPTGEMVFGDFLRQQGMAYIGVMSQRMVAYVLGPDYAVIENGLDGYEITADAAKFLRNPKLTGKPVPFLPTATKSVIGFGISHTAGSLRVMMQEGQNRLDTGELVFDGILAGVPTGCFPLHNDETRRQPPFPPNPSFYTLEHCESDIPDDGKFITIISESDYLQFTPTRPDSANHRQYELAGVSHIPQDMINVTLMGAHDQNPVSFKPFFKSALSNLLDWIEEDTEPPQSLYLSGKHKDGKFVLERDEDGNVLGGVRLPHMTSTTPDGQLAGAPLGTYTGLDTRHLKPLNLFNVLGGTFTPFSNTDISDRYGDHKTYVSRITRAADQMVEARFILPEDRNNFVRDAEFYRFPG